MKGKTAISQSRRDFLTYRMADAVLRCGLRRLPNWAWADSLALCWGYRFRPAPCLGRLRNGAILQLDEGDYLELMVYYRGTFEPHCLRYLRLCSRPGATIVDVGANIGVYTLESSLVVGPTGRVISIEAAPRNAQALRRNIELNGMENIVVLETAVGEITSSATLALSAGGNLGMFTLGAASGEKEYRVAVRRLDDLLAEKRVDKVDLIKMDIEGSEYHALLGAVGTLSRHRPTLVIELNEGALRGCRSSANEVKKLLRECGYRGWSIGRRVVRVIPDSQGTHDCDECLFIHRDNSFLIGELGLPN